MLALLQLIPDEQNREKADKIYWAYHTDMIRHAKHKLKRYKIPNYASDAEDVVQSSFIRIIEHIDKFDLSAPYTETRAYILAIVSNEAKKMISEHIYWEDLDDCADFIDKEKFFAELRIKEQYDRVIEAIRSLPDIYSLTLLQYYCEEKTPRQIADFMGIPEKTVYTRLNRGRTSLLNKLKEDGQR